MVDHRVLLNNELDKFKKELPGYSLCQTLFSALTVLDKKDFTKESLLTITDEELYSVVNICMRIETVGINDKFEPGTKLPEETIPDERTIEENAYRKLITNK